MSGLSAAGFERERLIDIKESIENSLKLVFGENINLIPQSRFGQLIGIFSEAIAKQWESQEYVYNSQYPSTASGAGLDNAVKLNGLARISEEFSTVSAIIYGTAGTIINAGSIIKTSDTNESFATDTAVTIPGGGSISATLTAIKSGSIHAGIGTLTVIGTPVYGWISANNTVVATLGRDIETDSELRDRQAETTTASGQNNITSLAGQLSNLSGVIDTLVLENKTDITDANGIPPHMFTAIVQSGEPTDIIDIVWSNTPSGINSFGSSSGVIVDSQGFNQTVYYTRPTNLLYYVKMDIVTDPLLFPASGSDDIKAAVVEYSIDNFGISDTVVYSQLYTPINETPGITGITLTIGLATNPTGVINLPVDVTEISVLTTARIEVNIV